MRVAERSASASRSASRSAALSARRRAAVRRAARARIIACKRMAAASISAVEDEQEIDQGIKLETGSTG